MATSGYMEDTQEDKASRKWNFFCILFRFFYHIFLSSAEFGPSEDNVGFLCRMRKFQTFVGPEQDKWEYKTTTTKFLGRLYTDLNGMHF